MSDSSTLGVIQSDLADMKSSMSKMADAISKIAILEERHQAMHNTMLRTLEKIEKQSERLTALEMEQVKQQTTIKVTIKAIQVAWAVIGAGVIYGLWHFIKMVAAAQG